MQFMDKTDKIFVAGHRGMVGSALVRRLEAEAFSNLLTRERAQLDLADESAVAKFFAEERPAIVIVAAAKVGGIKANNDYPVEFLVENLRIQNNVIRAAQENGVRKLLFLGSSCIYPKFAPQPIPETALLQRSAEQRSLRNCEDCRRQALPGVLQRIRGEFYLGYADEPLRPERQFRSGDISRAGCAHAQSA